MEGLLQLGSGQRLIRQEIPDVFIGAAIRLAILIFDDHTLIASQYVLPLPVEFGGGESESRDALHFCE